MQQVKPAKFGEGEEEGLRLSWEDAESYMEEHGITGDKGLYVDKAQEEYVSNLGRTWASLPLTGCKTSWYRP
eukprot:5806606-Karenia_brevis.AAC.1